MENNCSNREDNCISNCIYEKLIFVGSGILAFDCAAIAGKKGLPVQVWEYRLTESTVLEKRCQKEGIPYQSLEKTALHKELLAISGKCLIISAANSYLFPKDVLERDNLRVINWHNALLPEHKGRNAEAWSIFEGDSVTGITWHLVNTKVDEGDVLIQGKIEISSEDTALSVYRRQCKLGAELFGEILQDLVQGKLAPCRQKEGQGKLHYSWEIPGDGILQLDWSFEKISRFVRAMDYGALALLGPMHVEVEGCRYVFTRYKWKETEMTPGRTIAWEDNNLAICEKGKKLLLRDLTTEKGEEK